MLDKAVLNTAALNILAAFSPTFERFNLEYKKQAKLFTPRRDQLFYSLAWLVRSTELVDFRAVGDAVMDAAKAKGMKITKADFRQGDCFLRFSLTSRFAGRPVKMDFTFHLAPFSIGKVYKRDGYLIVQVSE